MNEPLSDPQLLEKLYTENYTIVYRLILHTLRSYIDIDSDADDLTQEVFIVAAKQIATLQSHPNPTGWLIATARNQCRNYVRALTRRNEMLSDAPELHASSVDIFAERDIQLSLQQLLRPEDYALLIAYCIKGRPVDEICREFGLSPTALRVRIHRIRKSLSTYFILLVTFAIIRNI